MKKWLFFAILALSVVSCSKDPTSSVSPPTENLASSGGLRTYIGFVASFCSHCQEEMPVLDQFYQEFKGQMKMQILVIDKKEFPWDFQVPMDSTTDLSYEQTTGEACEYVPSYVIYDENGKIIEKKCGGKLTSDELKDKLITQNTSLSTKPQSQTMANNYQTSGFQEGDVGIIMTTTNGKIELKLFPKDAPLAVFNFLALSQTGYYNNLTFHRVIKNFMIQWWDPEGTGMWGKSIYWGEFDNEISPNLKNIRGALSMANAGPDTNGSQFFINQKDNISLDGGYTVFGQVVTWLDNVDKIVSVKTGANDKPVKDVKMITVEPVIYQSGSLKPYTVDVEAEMKKMEDEKKAKAEANKNRVVKAGDVIKVDYKGTTTKDGKEFDSSYKRGTPIEFEVGAGKMIPWFDKWVLGMKVGEKKTLVLAPKDAYGEYDKKNIQEVPKTQFKGIEDHGITLEKWALIPTQYGNFKVLEVSDTGVTLDLNPELAGKELKFEVELVGFSN